MRRKWIESLFASFSSEKEDSFLRACAIRSYDRSIALYEETSQYPAGGVSSNVRYASVPVPLFFARGEGARGTRRMQGLADLAARHGVALHVMGVPTMFRTMFIDAVPAN